MLIIFNPGAGGPGGGHPGFKICKILKLHTFIILNILNPGHFPIFKILQIL